MSLFHERCDNVCASKKIPDEVKFLRNEQPGPSGSSEESPRELQLARGLCRSIWQPSAGCMHASEYHQAAAAALLHRVSHAARGV